MALRGVLAAGSGGAHDEVPFRSSTGLHVGEESVVKNAESVTHGVFPGGVVSLSGEDQAKKH
jgi:hypothetical protein